MSILGDISRGARRIYVKGKAYLVEPAKNKPKRKRKPIVHPKSRLGRAGASIGRFGSSVYSMTSKYVKEANKPKRRRATKRNTRK